MDAPSEAYSRSRILIWAALPTTLGLIVISLALLGSSTPSHTPPLSNSQSSAGQRFPLEISPDLVSLGVVGPGQPAQAIIKLRNPGAQPLTVQRVDTSCPCVRAEPESIVVAPGEIKQLRVCFDPSVEPAFQGGLSVNITGLGAEDRLLFRSRVDLDVRPDSRNGRGEYPDGAENRGRRP